MRPHADVNGDSFDEDAQYTFYGNEMEAIMEEKRLIRSRTNKMICGVCGGIGEYFHIDPTIIRLIWVILTIGGFGSGLLAYIVAAVIIPEEF